MQGKHVIAGAAAVLMLAAATVFAQVKNRASGEQENTFVSPGDQAVVALDRSHLEGNEVIRLEVILTAERIERDPAVGIRVDALCDGGCGADFQGVRSVELANVGLFPSLDEFFSDFSGPVWIGLAVLNDNL
ncbi:MAG: hypothetical protein AAF483_27820, partial [Planctomycetota bacterium]